MEKTKKESKKVWHKNTGQGQARSVGVKIFMPSAPG